ncbi:hypothetical protein [Peribacillus loiseleuriae]|uniref:hypothetical protein n=1 Tax=Peribacillus loiseleuriae TaxID=1679170 RepID=UPI003D05AEF8
MIYAIPANFFNEKALLINSVDFRLFLALASGLPSHFAERREKLRLLSNESKKKRAKSPQL